PSSEEEKSSFSEFFMRGAQESGILKRPLLRRTLLLAMVPLGLAPVVLLRDMGPLPGDKLKRTIWRDGTYLVVEGTNRRIRAEDLVPGSMISVLPEPDDPERGLSMNDQAEAGTILIKMDPKDFGPGMSQQQLEWTHDGIIDHSTVCSDPRRTSALFEKTTDKNLRPCHQSTCDPANAAAMVFGSAHRLLTKLPISFDEEGYHYAGGDLTAPVGPTFWDARVEDL